MKRKRKKLTRTETAMDNANRQSRLERRAVEFAEAMKECPTSWHTQRCRIDLLEASVAYWRGVQR